MFRVMIRVRVRVDRSPVSPSLFRVTRWYFQLWPQMAHTQYFVSNTESAFVADWFGIIPSHCSLLSFIFGGCFDTYCFAFSYCTLYAVYFALHILYVPESFSISTHSNPTLSLIISHAVGFCKAVVGKMWKWMLSLKRYISSKNQYSKYILIHTRFRNLLLFVIWKLKTAFTSFCYRIQITAALFASTAADSTGAAGKMPQYLQNN